MFWKRICFVSVKWRACDCRAWNWVRKDKRFRSNHLCLQNSIIQPVKQVPCPVRPKQAAEMPPKGVGHCSVSSPGDITE